MKRKEKLVSLSFLFSFTPPFFAEFNGQSAFKKGSSWKSLMAKRFICVEANKKRRNIHCRKILSNKSEILILINLSFNGSWDDFERIFHFYRVCHGLRLMKQEDYFWVNFDHFWIEHYFWRLLGQYWKLSPAQNQTTIRKFSLPKSMKRSVAFEFAWKRFCMNHKLFRFSLIPWRLTFSIVETSVG